MATQMSKKRKFVADAVFFAELSEVLSGELAEDGYSVVEVRVTPVRTEIIIRATRSQNVLGEEGRRIRELTSLVQKRFKFPENSVRRKLTTDVSVPLHRQSLCGTNCSEDLLSAVLVGADSRLLEEVIFTATWSDMNANLVSEDDNIWAFYVVLRFIVESGAKGCEVIVSGKLRAQRAKSMKFKDGHMISSGQPVNEYIDSAVEHVLLRQGVLGIKVKIMLDWDPQGKQGPKTPLPDLVTIHQPKEEEYV